MQYKGITVEPRFNEVAGDRPYLFVKSRVRYIENLDITNLRGNDQNVRYIEVKLIVNDNRKNPEYRVVAAIRKLRKDTNCPATTRYSGFFLLSLVTRFACDIGQLAKIWI